MDHGELAVEVRRLHFADVEVTLWGKDCALKGKDVLPGRLIEHNCISVILGGKDEDAVYGLVLGLRALI